MKLLPEIIILLAAIFAASCSNSASSSMNAATAATTLSPTADATGTLSTTLLAGQPVTFSGANLTSSSNNPLSKNFSITVPAGAISKPTAITVFETPSLVSQITPSIFGLDTITSTFPAIEISGDSSDIIQPITVKVPYSSSSSLYLDATTNNLAVILLSGSTLDIFTGNQIVIGADSISVQTSSFGAFQAVQISGSIQQPEATVTISTASLQSVVVVAATTAASATTTAATTTTASATTATTDSTTGATTSTTNTTSLSCGTVQSGQQATRTQYQSATVPYGITCASETQTSTCNNGTLGAWSGSYTFNTCSVNAAASCGSVASGQNATRTEYQTSTVPYGSTCASEAQTALCTNGTLGAWSGTYTFSSCTISNPGACGSTPNGQQANRTEYQAATVPYGSSCVSETQTATCNNGTLGAWSGTYTFSSCTVNAGAACGSVASGQQASRTEYQSATVPFGQTCVSQVQTATCTNGTLGSWSGTYTYASCTVNAPVIATLTGIPSNPSAATSLDITVGGSGVVSYVYGILANTPSCPSTTNDMWYNAALISSNSGSVATHIQADLSQSLPGTLLLCVWGQDAGSSWQVTPTSYSWTYLATVSYSSSASLQNPQYVAGTTLATGTSIGENLAAASSGSYIYVVSSDNQMVKLAKSTNNGASWSVSAITDSNSNGLVGYTLGIATGTNGNVFVIATDGSTIFAKSADYGGTWTFTTLDTNGASGDSLPSIAVNGANIYVSYPSFTSNPNHAALKFAKSTDGGNTWSSAQTIEETDEWGMPSSITYDSGKIYLAYVGYYLVNQNQTTNLTLATSTNGGSTWTKTYPVQGTVQDTLRGYRPAINVVGNNIKIFVDQDLFQSSDGGATWTGNCCSSSGFGTGANFIVNGSSVVVSYYTNNSSGQAALGISYSTDGAGTFTSQTVGINAEGWRTAIVNGTNKLFAFYKDVSNSQTYVTSSSDSGVTWQTTTHNITLSHKAIGGSFPGGGQGVVSMATDGTNVYAINSGSTIGGGIDIMKTAIASDSTWTNGRLPASLSGTGAAITATNQAIYIVSGNGGWSGYTQFLKSTDQGATWSSSSIDASGYINGDSRLGITVVGNNVYVCYPIIPAIGESIETVKFAKSTDDGSTWSAGNIKTIATSPNWGSTCSITTYNGNLYLAFVLGDRTQLQLARSTDSGSTWNTFMVDDRTANGGLSTLPALAASSSGVFIADGYLFYQSTNGGQTWSSETSISNDTNYYMGNSIATIGTNIIVSYIDYSNHNLYISQSVDGVTWTPQQIDTGDAYGSKTGLAVSGNNVYVGYGSFQALGIIKANKSTNGGTAFSW